MESIDIKSTGDAYTDTKALNDAVKHAKVSGDRLIRLINGSNPFVLDGHIQSGFTTRSYLKDRLEITTGLSIVGVGNVHIQRRWNYGLWLGSFAPVSTPITSTNNVHIGRLEHEHKIPAGELKKGQFIVIHSKTEIADLVPHADGANYPAELKRISKVENGWAYLDSPVIDKMDDASYYVLSMYEGVRIEGLTVAGSTTHGDNKGSFLTLQDQWDCRVTDYTTLHGGPITMANCYGVEISGHKNYGQQYNNNTYGVTFGGICTNCILRDSQIYECRHAVTTGGYRNVGGSGINYGINRHCVVDNVRAWASDDNNSNVVFDTHPEDYGLLFKDCEVHSTNDSGSAVIGFQSRSRGTRWVGCKFSGSWKTGVGWRTRGKYNSIENCIAENCWYGIETQCDRGEKGSCDRLTVNGFTAVDNRTVPIIIDGGKGHFISNYKAIRNNGGLAGQKPFRPRSLLHLTQSKEHRLQNITITESHLSRYNNGNQNSITWMEGMEGLPNIEMETYNCNMSGYGTGQNGMKELEREQ